MRAASRPYCAAMTAGPPVPGSGLLRSPLLAPLTVFALGAAVLGVFASGNAVALDLDVVRLAAWLAWPLSAAVLRDARPGHLLGAVVLVPGLLPPVLLVSALWETSTVPDVAEAARSAPHLAVVAATVLLVWVPLASWPGRLLDRAGRRIAALSLAVVAVALSAAALRAGPPGPAAPPTWLSSALEVVQRACLLAVLALSVLALSRLIRLRVGATGVERNRLDWFLAGSAGAALLVGATLLLPASALAVYVRSALVAAAPVALVALVLRSSVPPLDRALVRAALVSVAGAGLLLVHVTALWALGRTDLPDRRAAAGTVTALAALVLLPVYGSLRDRVLAAVIGSGHRPGQAMADLGRSVDATAEVDDAVAAALAAVASAVRSPLARLARVEEDAPAEAAVVPLSSGGVPLGRLVVLPRREGEGWGRRERALLEALAIPLASLLRAQQLTRELEHARGDAVAQRLDERRRLRRDLHDSVGPLLAGLGMQADALRRAAGPDDAQRWARVTDAARACRREIRRLVDEIEPDDVACEDLGAALADLVDGWRSATVESGLTLRLELPAVLPPLPPDLRLAAYRIAGEALANVAQHAAASSCTVRLAVDGTDLLLEVRDDGAGLTARRGATDRVGVGVRSMGERARAVGGSLDVGDAGVIGGRRPATGLAGPGGTCVRARFPLPVVLPQQQAAPGSRSP